MKKVKLANNYAIPNSNFLPHIGIQITVNGLSKSIDKVTKLIQGNKVN